VLGICSGFARDLSRICEPAHEIRFGGGYSLGKTIISVAKRGTAGAKTLFFSPRGVPQGAVSGDLEQFPVHLALVLGFLIS